MTHLSSSFYDSPFHGFRCLHSAGETIFKFSSSLPGRRVNAKKTGKRQQGQRERAALCHQLLFHPTQFACLLIITRQRVLSIDSAEEEIRRFQLFNALDSRFHNGNEQFVEEFVTKFLRTNHIIAINPDHKRRAIKLSQSGEASNRLYTNGR